jgi:hypothetical protein
MESDAADLRLSTIGASLVDAIDAGMIMKVLTSIWTEKNETPATVRTRIASILD